MRIAIFIALMFAPFLLAFAVMAEWIGRYLREWRDEYGTQWTAFVAGAAILLGWLVWLPVPFLNSAHVFVTILFALPGVWLSLHALTNAEHNACSGMFWRILLMQLTMALWLVVIPASLDKAH